MHLAKACVLYSVDLKWFKQLRDLGYYLGNARDTAWTMASGRTFVGELSQLKGLGPKSEEALNAIGIHTKAQLKALGAVRIFVQLQEHSGSNTSLNFLYALAGAIEDRPWTDMAKFEKAHLLAELAGFRESRSRTD